MRTLRGELDDYYRRYDNDSFCLFLSNALRGVGVVLCICFLLWPWGLYRSRDWHSAIVTEMPRDYGNGVFVMMTGYRVADGSYSFQDHYFGGNPPAAFGKLGLNRPDPVYYDPNNPGHHVATKAPSWMTILLPILACLSFYYAQKLRRATSPGAEARAHPYDPRKERG